MLVADELAKLVQLRDAGALTNEEFAAQKARLLGS
jgi:Short C-terminal domain